MSSYFIDFSFTEQYNILQRGGFVLNKEYYETVDKIKFELEKIRPKLIKDGGNIEFINFKNQIFGRMCTLRTITHYIKICN